MVSPLRSGLGAGSRSRVLGKLLARKSSDS
jgi:hypothetical protein